MASAQAWPAQPVRIVVGYPAGIAPDIRLVGQGLAERLGQPFIVDNRPGASTNIATEFVAKSAADGSTLLLNVAANTINSALYPALNFNFIRDFAPVASIGDVIFLMVVNPTVPANTVPEFIAYAKANPGKINMASRGNGSLTHAFGELFKMMAGVELVHVPYRGDYTADLLGGQVQVAFLALADSIGYVKDGRLRALALTTASRVAALPDVPVMGEFLPGYEASGWLGIGAPKGTAAEIVAKLNDEINAIITDPEMKTRLLAMGIEPTPMTTTAFGTFIAAETEKWAKVVKFADIKPD
jgi:tripartite-type tricarboxylate transporter receptor subunit TctC